MTGQNYQGLLVWQRAMDLVQAVYAATRPWPQDEVYDLTSQVRRAAVSVPANIAEGQGRIGPREFMHHRSIAHGSLRGVETRLLISQRLAYLDHQTLSPLLDQAAEVGRLLRGLMNSLGGRR